MYFIVNSTKKTIVLSDLHFRLAPRQAMDLDKRIPREKAERSKLLKACISKGIIKVKKKDKNEGSASNFLGPLLEDKPEIDIEEINKKLRKEMKDGMKKIEDKISKPVVNNNSISKDDIAGVLEQVLSKLTVDGKLVASEGNETKAKEVEVDSDELAKLHAQVVDKMTKNTETGSINYKKEKVSDDISSSVDELSDLLG